MKEIAIETYAIKLSKVRGMKTGEEDRDVDSRDLIEVTLDQIPQGGFTPKDIRDRNRIQGVLDKSRELTTDKAAKKLKFEDSDFENLRKLVNDSRWGARDKELQKFLDSFSKDKE